MKSLRWVLSIALAVYMTGAGRLALAQETDASITFQPLQYADVKGNVGKFEALNWMPAGASAGISDITFVKDINKNVSLDIEGSAFPKTDDGDGHLTLKDGDLAFLQIDYNAFRKYYDGTGGVFSYVPLVTGATSKVPGRDQGAEPNSPDLQMDISNFKLEAGIGPISDPFIDVLYEHDSKNGDKSLEQWESAYLGAGTSSTGQMKIAPTWAAINDTVDRITLKENKEIAGITIKGQQNAEIDYNNDITYMQYLNDNVANAQNENIINNDSPDAKLFGAGVRAEKWMLNDNTFAALGYHYNHTHSTDTMDNQVEEQVSGVVRPIVNSSATLWNTARAMEDDHVWVGNINTNLTKDLTFVADTRYEHMGSDGESTYYTNGSGAVGVTASDIDTAAMQNHQDQEGEHLGLRYSGISHTTLYTESEFEQDRNWVNYVYTDQTNPASNNFRLNRIDRTQDESWTVGGRIVPNRFFIFSTQVKQHSNDSQYDTVSPVVGSTGDILLDAIKENGVDETSTLTWKPYRWLQNSLKYQFSDTVYNPQEAEGATNGYPISENHMLSSGFTYDISVEPTDSILMMISYSHVENYVRTLQASEPSSTTPANNEYIPTFNSGDNSWLFSGSYMPTENLTWTNTVCYTLSNNYVDYTSGLPLGTNFKELNFTTGLDYTFHKWLTLGPKYEHASYRDNSLAGDGNYSANIFMFDAKFSW